MPSFKPFVLRDYFKGTLAKATGKVTRDKIGSRQHASDLIDVCSMLQLDRNRESPLEI